MDIKTKYNVGDVAWYYGTDGLKKFVVDSILINVMSKSQIEVEYVSAPPAGTEKGNVHMAEDKVFPSKAELIKSL